MGLSLLVDALLVLEQHPPPDTTRLVALFAGVAVDEGQIHLQRDAAGLPRDRHALADVDERGNLATKIAAPPDLARVAPPEGLQRAHSAAGGSIRVPNGH